MRWESPLALFLLVLLPVLAILLAVSIRQRQKRFSIYTKDNHIKFYNYFFAGFSPFKWKLKNWLLLIVFFLIIIAAARPQWNKELQIVKKEGIDIVIAVDVSKSMDATDISPSRIERAKDQISLFIDQLKGDRIAIVTFAGRSFVQCPLTDDYGAAKLFLSMINTDIIKAMGTNIGDALNKAVSLFGESQKYKVIVLISDGEDLEAQAIKTAQKLATSGVIIYALGVGSPAGSTIPQKSANGDVEYAKDDDGNIVFTKLDIDTLQKLAAAGNGKFYPVTPRQSEIFDIMKQISSIEKQKFDSKEFVRYKEQFKYFVILALFILILESFINFNKKSAYKKTL